MRRGAMGLCGVGLMVASIWTAGPAQATFPGTNGRIAFVRTYHGGDDIFTMSPDGSDVRQLTHLAPHHQAENPAWSPDGSQIVFERVNARFQRNQIWLMDSDGSKLHRLFPDPWFMDETPSFSPDGTKVLFSRCQNDPGQDRCTVATVNADGTGMVRLTTPSAEELAFWPRYSPDGSQIAFTVFYGRGVRSGIFVMKADGSNVRLVTPPGLWAWDADWAPDGSRLAFSTYCCDPRPSAIWSVNPDGTRLTKITAAAQKSNYEAAYAPDGTRIVFRRQNTDGSRIGLYTMNPDGTGITRILNGGFSPAWQPAA